MIKFVRKIFIPVCILAIVLICAGCSNNKANQNVSLSADGLISILGQAKEDVFKSLSLDPSSDVAETSNSGRQEKLTLTKPFSYQDQQGKVALLFYDNVFFGMEYIFDESENTCFDLAKEIYDSNEKMYGAAATYTSLPNRIKDLDENQFKAAENGQWIEQWAVPGQEQIVKLFKDNGSLFLRMTLKKQTTEQSSAAILALYYTVE